jgi:heterodisulfide reductase subunit C
VASRRALAYLAYRALLAHPLKRLRRRQRGNGLQQFERNYVREGLVPTTDEDRAIAEAAQDCICCGLCEPGCGLAGAAPAVRALGLHAVFRLYSRNAAESTLAAEALVACAGCTGCDALCPTGVPISRIVTHLASRATSGRDAPRSVGSDPLVSSPP